MHAHTSRGQGWHPSTSSPSTQSQMLFFLFVSVLLYVHRSHHIQLIRNGVQNVSLMALYIWMVKAFATVWTSSRMKPSDKNNVIFLSASGHTTRLTPGQPSASHSWCAAPCSLWVSTLARSCYRWLLFHTTSAQCQVSEKSLEMCICLWPEFDCPEVTLCGWQDINIQLLLLLLCC